jgi:hypothetical protein
MLNFKLIREKCQRHGTSAVAEAMADKTTEDRGRKTDYQVIRTAGYQVKDWKADDGREGNMESFDHAQGKYRTRNFE